MAKLVRRDDRGARTPTHSRQSRDVAVCTIVQIIRAKFAVRIGGITLDRGEESRWAHALERVGTWFLCGPDRASLRVAVQLGLRERLVSLEELLEKAGHRPKHKLRPAYGRKWMNRVIDGMVVAEFGRR